MPVEEIDFNQIEDEKMRQLVSRLLNIIEDLSANVHRLQEENQRLRDEINRLKGEQGKPEIKPKKSKRDHSSEKERHRPKSHRKGSKRSEIKIDRFSPRGKPLLCFGPSNGGQRLTAWSNRCWKLSVADARERSGV